MYPNYLKHFGILGMRWGVRRYQNPDGSLTPAGRKKYGVGKREESSYTEKTFSKGSTLYRVTSKDENLASGRGVYVVSTNDDRNNVKAISGWLANKRGVNANDLYEHQYEVNEDVKVASLSTLKDAQRKVIKEHPEFAKSAAYHLLKEKDDGERQYGDRMALFPDENEDESQYEKRLYKYYKGFCDDERAAMYAQDESHQYFKNKRELDSAIEAIGDKSLDEIEVPAYIKGNVTKAIDNEIAASHKYQKLVMQELSKQGYNAMYDNNMNNAGRSGTAEADEALILFDKKLISEVGKTQLSDNEIADARKKSDIWRKDHTV